MTDHPPEDWRVVGCEACGTEGRIYRSAGHDRTTGAPQEDDCGPCPYCEGTGGEMVPVFPIDLTDLDLMET